MKIWITRKSAFQIQCGGLERLDVWFRKPVWVDVWRDRPSYDLPFAEESEKNGARISDWEVREGKSGIRNSLSFGELFGYSDRREASENNIAEFVWQELCNHFDNSDFNTWHELDGQSDKFQRREFLLEIDIELKLNHVHDINVRSSK